MEVLYATLVLAILGLFLGIGIAIFSKIFYVKEDNRIEEITKKLPGYNCGACGYPGCSGMAEALVTKKEKDVSKCKPSKPNQREEILEYLKEHENEE